MSPRRVLALMLALFPALPAAAQVRAVPAEAASAPVGRLPAGTSASLTGGLAAAPGASLLAPSLTAPSVSAASPLAPARAAASAPSADPVAAASPVAGAAAPAPAAQFAAPAAAASAPLALAPAPRAASPLGRDAAAPLASFSAPSAVPGEAAALDALFDGSRAAPADGVRPETGSSPRASAPRLGRTARLVRGGLVVPAALAVSAVAVAAPHAAVLGVHWLGQAAYWLANPFAFLFTMPQVHRMLARRSADVSSAMIGVGVLATAAATANFAFDGKDLMMYRNLAQFLGFAAMFALQRHYARTPGLKPPSARRALVEAGALALALTGLMALGGPGLMALVPTLKVMGALLVPLQIASGFGFTYLMYAQLAKMRRSRSAGDSSRAMMWAYLGTKTIWIWSLATMVSLATAPARITIPAAAAFAAICWVAGQAALKRLLASPWRFLPSKLSLRGRTLTHEHLVDMGAFVALSALILLLSGVGYLAFVDLLGVPAAATARFAMYLLYGVQSLVACLATLKTLRLQKRFHLTSGS